MFCEVPAEPWAIPGSVHGTERRWQNPVKAALGQLHSQEILMQDLAARMCSRHRDELPRSIEPNGFVPERSEVAKIPAGSATEIKDPVGRVTLYGIEQCRIILADIVVSRTVPEGSGEPIVKRDRRLAEAADLFRIMWFSSAAHQNRAPVSRSFIVLIHHRSSALEHAVRIGRCEWRRPCSAGFSRKPSFDRLGRPACGRGTAGAGACPSQRSRCGRARRAPRAAPR